MSAGRGTQHDRTRRVGLRLLSSSLTRRILAINLLVLLSLPVGSIFYFSQYQERLIQREIATLRMQGNVIAGALGAGAIVRMPGIGQRFEPVSANVLLRRAVLTTPTRIRLFGSNGTLLTDTRDLSGRRGVVRIFELPLPSGQANIVERIKGIIVERSKDIIDVFLNMRPGRGDLPIYREPAQQSASDYTEVRQALQGEPSHAVRGGSNGGIVLTVAFPVERYKQVVGAVLLSADSAVMEDDLRAVIPALLGVSSVALMVTVALSLYLSGTIAQPLRRLAASAELMRKSKNRLVDIPDLSDRSDEIGELSASLRDMTSALWERLDAIESFAADLAHEIKNPLTSLRSAVETVAHVTDPEQQRKLMTIILDDVQRLDRLISEISDASRLDAELSRDQPQDVDLRLLLGALADIERAAVDSPILNLSFADDAPFIVLGLESRLGQVFRNVIQNAKSFSPSDGIITVAVIRVSDTVRVAIEDQGPGIADNMLEAIFTRFYSYRPRDRQAVSSGHSGLGLSISKQIVEAGGGRIWAENRGDEQGGVLGARFVIELVERAV